MNSDYKELSSSQKIYLASDFHLGAPSYSESRMREQKIINWLDSIKENATAIFLLGDLFDFWFEYQHVIPKGYVRFLGKLAEISDQGIALHIFTGNHDLWMFDYFDKEFKATIHRNPESFEIGTKKYLIGHGDGLGPGDRKFKIFKKVFKNRLAQWAFRWLHPDLGIKLANKWSTKSRMDKDEEEFRGDDEWLLQYCRRIEKSRQHYDYYIFGHRHLTLEIPINEQSTYFNLGEWIEGASYLEIQPNSATLKTF